MSIYSQVSTLILGHIAYLYTQGKYEETDLIKHVKKILKDNLDKYDLDSSNTTLFSSVEYSSEDFQLAISTINEKESRRKKEGVYYTGHDLTNYIVANSFLHHIYPEESNVYSYETAVSKILAAGKDKVTSLINASIYDPTCGAGEFLISALELKIALSNHYDIPSLRDIVSTIHGNDIYDVSTDITKLRIYFHAINTRPLQADELALSTVLNKNFTNIDAVANVPKKNVKYDIILGNPPYVEYRNYPGTVTHEYGNVYADVLDNAINCLAKDGILSFVIPLSYVSTIRMNSIREHIASQTSKQIVLNFADRPDSLFSSVHQKLTVVFAQKSTNKPILLSSGYNYWYQNERIDLFNKITVYPVEHITEEYIPKIGNATESTIYKKISSFSGESIISSSSNATTGHIYLNQRACFWIKAFLSEKLSSSYVKLPIKEDYAPFVFCLLNSSLFFLLWIIISDGWHITNKELSFIKVPSEIGDKKKWKSLSKKLEDKLEETKVYVGTKQVDYEYKHKFCKSIIDKIDDELATIYELSEEEIKYIKNFALKYRMSDVAQ